MLQLEIPTPYGMTPPVDPVVLSTINRWNIPRYPRQDAKFRLQVERLCKQLESSPRVKVKNIEFTENEDEISRNKEDLRIYLEFTRSLLMMLEGATLERIKRQVREYTPYLSDRLITAADKAKLALRDSEQSLLFLLDEPVEDEWLPDPAPSGRFDKNADSIPLEPA